LDTGTDQYTTHVSDGHVTATAVGCHWTGRPMCLSLRL